MAALPRSLDTNADESGVGPRGRLEELAVGNVASADEPVLAARRFDAVDRLPALVTVMLAVAAVTITPIQIGPSR